MEPKVLEGPPDESGVPRESPAKLLLEACNTYPDNTALIDIRSGASLTHGQLCQLAKNLAASLRLLGIKKDDIIGVVSENSHKFVVAYLAGLFLAAPLHLIGPGFTKYELRHMFALSKPTVVFCTDKSQKNVFGVVNEFTFVKAVVSFDDAVDKENEILAYSDLIKKSVSFQVEEDVDLEDQVALILNSSGTTGFPKGVMFTYKMLRTNLVHARDPDFLYMKQKEVVPLVPPMFHLYGMLITNAALYSGATLAIFDHFVPTIFLETIQKYKMEQLMLVPTLINFLANSPLVDQYDLSSVKQVWSGGSHLLEEDSKTVWNRLNLQKLHVMYGMTETAIAVQTSDNRKEGCGRVTCGFRIKITDPETGRKLPAGQSGEICIGGAVTKGYLNDPQKTKETIDAEGFIHSGDIGYYDPAGTIYIVGRYKDIIKYKSYQVSPVELEAILVKHPQICDAAVVGKADRRFGEVPVGFIVKEEGATLTERQICDFLATFVSVEKRLHGGVRFVDVIPRNDVGKISRCDLTKLLQDEFKQNK
ncbi:hypothetical protein MTP99_004834 [Tenebrio molitor]|nr:hypothetical protein MTP99_004834 [Tenebrio molitor]